MTCFTCYASVFILFILLLYINESRSECLNTFAGFNVETSGGKPGGGNDVTKEWSPFQLRKEDQDFVNHTLLILNTPIELSPKMMEALWNQAIIRLQCGVVMHSHWYRFTARSEYPRNESDLLSKKYSDSSGILSLTNSNTEKSDGVITEQRTVQNDDDFTEFLEDDDIRDKTQDMKGEKIAQEGGEEEGDEERYNFFTFSNIMWHFIIFMACFLLY